MINWHVKALVELLENVSEPKNSGVKSGYSPHHKFKNVDYLVSGFHTYSDDEMHYPGEGLQTNIVFPSWEYFESEVKVGDRFEVRELDRLIGLGVIQSINRNQLN